MGLATRITNEYRMPCLLYTSAFGMDASEADNLLDALNATGQATGIDMDTLANALSSNAAQLKEMGLTAQQAAGFMGMVEMSGLDTSAAMMGLKTAMKNATADGKTLDQALAEFSTTMQGSGSDAEKLQAAYDPVSYTHLDVYKRQTGRWIMTYDDVITMLEEAGLPLAYDHFAEGESPDPPFLVFLYPGSDNMFADDTVFKKIDELNIELYTDVKDPETETQIEDILIAHDLPYEKSEVWIESEKLYEVLSVSYTHLDVYKRQV